MFEVFNADLSRIAILQNAFNIEEISHINSIGHLTFTLPADDIKNQYCQPFNYVRFNGGELYRVLPSDYSFAEQDFNIYECEHVIATLIDDPLIGWHKVGNIGYFTKQAIEYVLSHQTVKRWVLDECDFKHQFEYGWEKENLASALFSIPLPFTARYMWVYNTKNYPWKISLKKIDTEAIPKHYLRTTHNVFSLTQKSDPSKICTRIYPYGAGEGINQLVINKINNNKPYLDASEETKKKYGLKVLQWVDRRYTNVESLKSAAQAIIDEMATPYVEYSVKGLNINAQIGEMVKVIDNIRKIDYNNIVIEVRRKYSETIDEQIIIANKPNDTVASVADLADRQRIEQNYSQGATQHYSVIYSDNADINNPAELYFFIPDEMLNINAVMLKVELKQFRAYSKATQSGGNTNTSTSSSSTTATSTGGNYNTGTSSSSSTSTSTGGDSNTGTSSSSSTSTGGGGNTYNSGGGSRTSGSSGIDFNRWGRLDLSGITTTGANGPGWHTHKSGNTFIDFSGVYLPSDHTHNYDNSYSISIPSHSHGMNHNHSVNTQHSHNMSHTHSVNTQHDHGMAHTHSINTQHSHNITPVIQAFGSATNFAILINGVQKMIVNSRTFEGDIVSYLIVNDKIPRGQWHTIGIKPLGGDGLARPHISLHLSGFVQSRGDKTV